MDVADTRYASRKFLLATLVVLLATVLVSTHIISDTVYQNIVLGVIGTYFVVNTTQNLLTKKDST